MLTKEKIIDAINSLPNNFSMDDVLDELMLIQKIEKGLEESKNGEVTADEDLDEELPKWLK